MNGATGYPIRRLAVLLVVLWCAGAAQAQQAGPDEGHLEVPEDARIEGLRSEAQSAPANVIRNGLRSVQVNTSIEGLNIVGDAANEPSLAIDPTDPDQWLLIIVIRDNDNYVVYRHLYREGE